MIDVQAVVSLCYLSSQGYFILTINENKSKTVMTEPAKKIPEYDLDFENEHSIQEFIGNYIFQIIHVVLKIIICIIEELRMHKLFCF